MNAPELTLERLRREPYRRNVLDRTSSYSMIWVELLIAQQDYEHAHRRLHRRGDPYARGQGLYTWAWFASSDPFGTARVRVGFQLRFTDLFSRRSTRRSMLRAVQGEVIDPLCAAAVRFRLAGIRSRGRIHTPIAPFERLEIDTTEGRERWPWRPAPDKPAWDH